MKTSNILLIGAAGLAAYYLWQHSQAAGQITDLASSTKPPGSLPSTQVITPQNGQEYPATVLPPPITLPIAAQALPDQTQLTALLTWANSTPNPVLYKQMVNQLTADQLNGLYGILINQWDAGVPPTAAETSFWNTLRLSYPFLNTQGRGCTNLQCTA